MDEGGSDRAIEWLWTIPGVTAVERVYGDNTITACVRADQYSVASSILDRVGFEVLGAKVRLVRHGE